MMGIRPYRAGDYATASAWWRGHGWEPVPEQFLPVLGVVVLVDDVPAAMAWLKQENSTPIGMMEWLVTNPDNAPRDSVRAHKQAVEAIKDVCKATGRTTLFTFCKQPSLARAYERCGFTRSDDGMIHLVCNL